MDSFDDLILRHGGLIATFELHREGYDRHSIARAVKTRVITRVRQGWFASPQIHPELREAARVGGRLSCASGIALQGFWSHPTDDLHIAVNPNTCRLRTRTNMRERLADATQPNTRIHWRQNVEPIASTRQSRLMLTPIECLTDALSCQPIEIVACLADAVLRTRPSLARAWSHLVEDAPTIHRNSLRIVDGMCESGTESLLRFRMQRFGLRLRSQVTIAGVGRVDFCVGDQLVIEVDGMTYHSDPERFENDRHRDAVLSRLGFRVLRFSYRQIMHGWAEVESAILSAVFRGDHL